MMHVKACWVCTSHGFFVFFTLPCTDGLSYPCALTHWFDYVAEEPDELTRMWMVKPSFTANGIHHLAVIHIDTIVQAAHLIPIFGQEHVPPLITFHNSLDAYCGFYINHFVDHHTFELHQQNPKSLCQAVLPATVSYSYYSGTDRSPFVQVRTIMVQHCTDHYLILHPVQTVPHIDRFVYCVHCIILLHHVINLYPTVLF